VDFDGPHLLSICWDPIDSGTCFMERVRAPIRLCLIRETEPWGAGFSVSGPSKYWPLTPSARTSAPLCLTRMIDVTAIADDGREVPQCGKCEYFGTVQSFPVFRVQYFRLKAAKSSFRVVGQFSETYSIWFAKMLAEGSLTTVGLRPPSVSHICFGIKPSSKVAARPIWQAHCATASNAGPHVELCCTRSLSAPVAGRSAQRSPPARPR